VLPLLVFGCATLLYLLRPAITPHQPYASRRLVPAVLPGAIVLAVWLASWLTRRSRALRLVDVPDYLKRTPRKVVLACCAAVIVLPPATGNFHHGLAMKRTFAGEIGAVNQICAAIPEGTSVLIIDAKMMLEFGQAIRGTCSVPVAGAQTTIPGGFQPDAGNIVEPATIIAAVAAIEDSGHTPFVLAATQAEFAPLIKQYGIGVQNSLVNLTTEDDEHAIFGTPKDIDAETFTAYSWQPGR
jgi:hypothetical protein